MWLCSCCYLRCIEKKLQLLWRRHIHRTQVCSFLCPLPLPVKWKAKAPTNLEGKKGLNRTLVKFESYGSLLLTQAALLLWVLTLLLSCRSTWWELGGNTLGTLRIQKTQRFSPASESCIFEKANCMIKLGIWRQKSWVERACIYSCNWNDVQDFCQVSSFLFMNLVQCFLHACL